MTTDSRRYTVPDISCDHCKRAIEAKVAPLAGVDAVDVDVDAKTVTVVGGDPEAIESAIVDAGYSIAGR
jgi:copper chaperone CopZ